MLKPEEEIENILDKPLPIPPLPKHNRNGRQSDSPLNNGHLFVMLLSLTVLFYFVYSIVRVPSSSSLDSSRAQYYESLQLNKTSVPSEDQPSNNKTKETTPNDQKQTAIAKVSDQETFELRKEKQKIRWHKKKMAFFAEKSIFPSFQYIANTKYNMVYSNKQSVEQEYQKYLKEEYEILNRRYKIDQYPTELSICVVVYAKHSKKEYAAEYLLTSIFNQVYSKFHVVYIADELNDDERETLDKLIKENEYQRYVDVVEGGNRGYFENVLRAINTNCQSSKVIALMGGDDELLSSHVFKIFNSVYQRTQANVVYGNYIEYHLTLQQVMVGYSSSYSDQEKKDNTYKDGGIRFGPLITFRKKLIQYVEDKDLRNVYGQYYEIPSVADYALVLRLLELSCGKVEYIPEHNYLFYGYKTEPVSLKTDQQNYQIKHIKSIESYKCYKYM